MTKDKKLKDDASDFVTFMYQKGYRGRFMMDRKEWDRIIMNDQLSDCLEQFMEKYIASERKNNLLVLDTFPPYNDVHNSVLCRFEVQYDAVKGFLVKEAVIYNKRTNDKKTFRLINNHQVPGSQAVLAMYPKPKPWDDMRRGKFRL